MPKINLQQTSIVSFVIHNKHHPLYNDIEPFYIDNIGTDLLHGSLDGYSLIFDYFIHKSQ